MIKNKFLTILFITVIAIIAFSSKNFVKADTINVDGINYEYNVLEDNTVSLKSWDAKNQTTLTIPSTIDGYPVSEISSNSRI